MMRLVASIILEVLANAVGLLAASWILAPAFSIDAIGFITVVAIFSAVRFILAPLITQLSMRHARMLVGGVSLVTILVSFFVTSLLTNHLVITGLSTWVLATLIVWVFGVIAMLLLPMVVFKKTLAETRAGRPPSSLGYVLLAHPTRRQEWLRDRLGAREPAAHDGDPGVRCIAPEIVQERVQSQSLCPTRYQVPVLV